MDRITNHNLDQAFQTLVNVAIGAGIDPTGWSFGRHYSNSYVILDPSRASGTAVSRSWSTKREAWNGLVDMAQSLMLVSR